MTVRNIARGALAARDFVGAGVTCGLKGSGAPDLVIIYSRRPAVSAAAFTTNRLCAAPVQLSRRHARRGLLRAIVANSGNANACTGAQGLADARAMAQAVARSLGIQPFEVGVASTGVIGHALDMAKVRRGIELALAALERTPRAAASVARAIMTTDTVPKSVALQCPIGPIPVRIGGVAKGVGMIAPHLAQACLPRRRRQATMLCFMTTDAVVEPQFLRHALAEAVAQTFNTITVDGDTSTNDTVFLLANGAAGNAPIRLGSPHARTFSRALTCLCDQLARRLVADGEGATKFIEIRVTGAASDADARKVARAIAQSPLFKTAMYGNDPNWGRIVAATGYSGARVREGTLCIAIGGVPVVVRGAPQPVPPRRLAQTVAGKQVLIEVALGLGKGNARIYTCDLSHEYVNINAHYTT